MAQDLITEIKTAARTAQLAVAHSAVRDEAEQPIRGTGWSIRVERIAYRRYRYLVCDAQGMRRFERLSSPRVLEQMAAVVGLAILAEHSARSDAQSHLSRR